MVRVLRTVLCAAILLVAGEGPISGEEARPGVIAKIKGGTDVDAVILPNYWFYHAEGEPLTPFLKAGEYVVEFSGLVSVDLRGLYTLQAELNGEVAVLVNGQEVLRGRGSGEMLEAGKSIRLNKGTNHVAAIFLPPKEGAAQFRLYWIPRKGVRGPIPQEAITHVADEVTARWSKVRRGRELFGQFRCAKCHLTPMRGMPELGMDAPGLAGIGERLEASWMAEWIADPRKERPQAKMPKLLRGAEAEENAQAIAAFLGTLQNGEEHSVSQTSSPDRGRELFANLRCGSCHTAGETGEEPPNSISLDHVARKFRPGALESFLMNPRAHFQWSEMPDFRLSEEEASALAAWLRKDDGGSSEPSTDREMVRRGRMLTETMGCLNCHAQEIENRFEAPALDQLAGVAEKGCLAPEPPEDAADFGLAAKEREALSAFVATGLDSLERENVREFAMRQLEALNCVACHGKAEGFTPLHLLGEKLEPEWSRRFIGGEVPYKPRPWLAARMPVFPERAESLARGLAVLHGHAPEGGATGPINAELAEVGRKLVSAEGGFSCTACHAVGVKQAPQIFESPGVNLAYSGERLREAFFHRWMLDPLAVDPATKMPVYFDDAGRSPLTDVFEGDAHQQIEALWEYLRSEAAKLKEGE